jgi:hypothetical protein
MSRPAFIFVCVLRYHYYYQLYIHHCQVSHYTHTHTHTHTQQFFLPIQSRTEAHKYTGGTCLHRVNYQGDRSVSNRKKEAKYRECATHIMWACKIHVGAGWSTKSAADNVDFIVDVEDGIHKPGPKICIYPHDIEFEQGNNEDALVVTLSDVRTKQLTLHSMMIKSNSKFVELYRSNTPGSDEDFVYDSTVRCYVEKGSAPGSTEFSGDISDLLLPFRRLRLKFLSIKGDPKVLRINGIAMSLSGLQLSVPAVNPVPVPVPVVVSMPAPTSYTATVVAENNNSAASSVVNNDVAVFYQPEPPAVSTIVHSATAPTVSPAPPAHASSQQMQVPTFSAQSTSPVPSASASAATASGIDIFAALAANKDVMGQLLAFRSGFLAEISIMMDVKLNPIETRLSRMEQDIRSMRESLLRLQQSSHGYVPQNVPAYAQFQQQPQFDALSKNSVVTGSISTVSDTPSSQPGKNDNTTVHILQEHIQTIIPPSVVVGADNSKNSAATSNSPPEFHHHENSYVPVPAEDATHNVAAVASQLSDASNLVGEVDAPTESPTDHGLATPSDEGDVGVAEFRVDDAQQQAESAVATATNDAEFQGQSGSIQQEEASLLDCESVHIDTDPVNDVEPLAVTTNEDVSPSQIGSNEVDTPLIESGLLGIQFYPADNLESFADKSTEFAFLGQAGSCHDETLSVGSGHDDVKEVRFDNMQPVAVMINEDISPGQFASTVDECPTIKNEPEADLDILDSTTASSSVSNVEEE